MADANAMTPRQPHDSDRLTDRELLNRMHVSFDQFTIRLMGVQFNGEERILDRSGGEIGRLSSRVCVLETGYKLQAKVIIAMLGLILLNGGITNAETIWNMMQKIFGK